MSSRPPRGPRTVVLLLLVLGAASLVLSAQAWVTATGRSVLGPEVEVAVSGATAAPGVTGAALLLAAAALALTLVRRAGRWVVAAGVVAGGVVAVVSAAGVLSDPESVARAAVSEQTGVGVLVAGPELTVAPVVTIVVGCLAVLAGLWAALGRWAGGTARYERPAARTGGSDQPAGAGGTPAATAGTSSGVSTTTNGPEPDSRADWDALSEGRDPT